MSQLTTAVSLKRAPYSSKALLIPSSAYTVASTPVISSTLRGTEYYDSFNALLQLTALSGATTVDVYFQGLAPDGLTWFDIAALVTKTATGSTMFTWKGVGGWEFRLTDGTLGPGAVNTCNMPSQFRIKVVLGVGTSATFQIDVEFFRRGA